jgi:flagella basal body P-ring formation protein FlgA
MASFSVKPKMTRVAIAVIAASLTLVSFAVADTTTQTANASVASDRSGAADATNITAQVQAQLTAMVPAGTRVDRVELGCKPPPGSTLKTIAPGFAELISRAFMVELQKGDRSTFCSAVMEASRRVLIAARDIQPGEPVTSTDFEPRWVDAFGGSAIALLEFPTQGPYASTTVIRAGQPLNQSALLRPIAVHPGEMVIVQVTNGPIRVRAQLQAQAQAAIGDTVTVVNPATGIPLTVTVKGPKTAELVMQ